MTNRFLMSVAAAALIAGTGLAKRAGNGTRGAVSRYRHPAKAAPSSDRACAIGGNTDESK